MSSASPLSRVLSRRRVIGTLGLTAAGATLTACGGISQHRVATTDPDVGTTAATDFTARFADYAPADELNGNLDRVIWPDFVIDAGPDIQRLYAFQVTNGDLMRYMPCFCGCHLHDGHRNNRDCYIRQVHPDGSVTFDPMAPVCGVCLDVTSAVIDMLDQGVAPRAIRAAIDAHHAHEIEMATPTPYPPASWAKS